MAQAGKVVVIGNYDIGADSSKTMAQSVSKSTNGQETRAIDKDGNIVGVVISQIVSTRTIEMIMTPGELEPEIGADYDGGKVTDVQVNSSNSDFKRLTVTVTDYNVAPASAS